MSLFGALRASITGVASNSQAISHISDNIANINTVGYKRVDTKFSTFITEQNARTVYTAGGVRTTGVREIDQQGAISTTNYSTDLAISGDGFFVVTDKLQRLDNGEYIPGGEIMFTRSGEFRPDADGNLRNTDGMYVLAWPRSEDGTGFTETNYFVQMRAVNVTNQTYDPIPTTELNVGANLHSGAGTGYGNSFVTSLDVVDKRGAPHRLIFRFERSSDVNGNPVTLENGQSEWHVLTSVVNGDGERESGFFNPGNYFDEDNTKTYDVSNAAGEVHIASARFDSEGRLISLNDPIAAEAVSSAFNIDVDKNGVLDNIDTDGDGVGDLTGDLVVTSGSGGSNYVTIQEVYEHDADGDRIVDSVIVNLNAENLRLSGNSVATLYGTNGARVFGEVDLSDTTNPLITDRAQQVRIDVDNDGSIDYGAGPNEAVYLIDRDGDNLADAIRIDYNIDVDPVPDTYFDGVDDGTGVNGLVFNALNTGDAVIRGDNAYGIGRVNITGVGEANIANVRRVNHFGTNTGWDISGTPSVTVDAGAVITSNRLIAPGLTNAGDTVYGSPLTNAVTFTTLSTPGEFSFSAATVSLGGLGVVNPQVGDRYTVSIDTIAGATISLADDTPGAERWAADINGDGRFELTNLTLNGSRSAITAGTLTADQLRVEGYENSTVEVATTGASFTVSIDLDGDGNFDVTNSTIESNGNVGVGTNPNYFLGHSGPALAGAVDAVTAITLPSFTGASLTLTDAGSNTTPKLFTLSYSTNGNAVTIENVQGLDSDNDGIIDNVQFDAGNSLLIDIDDSSGHVLGNAAGSITLFEAGTTNELTFPLSSNTPLSTSLVDIQTGGVTIRNAILQDTDGGGNYDAILIPEETQGVTFDFFGTTLERVAINDGDRQYDHFAVLFESQNNLSVTGHGQLRVHASSTRDGSISTGARLNGNTASTMMQAITGNTLEVDLDVDGDGTLDIFNALLVDTDGDNRADALANISYDTVPRPEDDSAFSIAIGTERRAPQDANGNPVPRNGGGITGAFPNRVLEIGIDFDDNENTLGRNSDRQVIEVNFGSQYNAIDDTGGSDGLTQVWSSSQEGITNFLEHNGRAFSSLTSVDVQQDGTVEAFYDNGESRQTYQVPLVTFANPNGLRAMSGNIYLQTEESGLGLTRIPGAGGSGSINSSSLEEATVDLGEEFSNMIISQQAYSASTRLISTADTLLQELVSSVR